MRTSRQGSTARLQSDRLVPAHKKEKQMTTRHALYASPIGNLTLVVDGDALVGIYFPDHWTNPDTSTFGELVPLASDGGFAEPVRQLAEYFAGLRTTFDLTTAPIGSEFQRSVWAILAGIPFGETVTYGQIARELGSPTMARLVGGAVGSNPLSIVVPCHRVVGSNGSLTGYAGGLERKRFLLNLEEPEEASSERLF